MAIPRNYHSVALLLPDGRDFLSWRRTLGQHGNQPPGRPGLQPALPVQSRRQPRDQTPDRCRPIDRPRVRQIQLAATGDCRRFTMVRMAATTHAFSSDIRFLNVSHTPLHQGVQPRFKPERQCPHPRDTGCCSRSIRRGRPRRPASSRFAPRPHLRSPSGRPTHAPRPARLARHRGRGWEWRRHHVFGIRASQTGSPSSQAAA